MLAVFSLFFSYMIKRKLVQAFIFITFTISSNFKVKQNQGRKVKVSSSLLKKSMKAAWKLSVNFSLIKLKRQTSSTE
jgi:hypothetical protein